LGRGSEERFVDRINLKKVERLEEKTSEKRKHSYHHAILRVIRGEGFHWIGHRRENAVIQLHAYAVEGGKRRKEARTSISVITKKGTRVTLFTTRREKEQKQDRIARCAKRTEMLGRKRAAISRSYQIQKER